MPRVKKETKKAVELAIVDLEEKDPSIIKECGLCNKALFDRLQVIANKCEAPRKTVCDIFAGFYNDEKPEEEHISGKAFRDRMERYEKKSDEELFARNEQINQDPKPFDLMEEVEKLLDSLRNRLNKWPEKDLHQAVTVIEGLLENYRRKK